MKPTLTARTAGVLFILASATAVAGGSLLLPVDDPGFQAAGRAPAQVVTGALLELVLAVSVAAIAAVLWPLLRRTSEPLAMVYVTTRTLEGVLSTAAATCGLVVARGGGAVASDARHWTYNMSTLIVFGVSAVVLGAVLVRSVAVPGWLAWWGLIGGALLLVRGILELYGAGLPGPVQAILAAPIGVQEMVFAAWLLWKGDGGDHRTRMPVSREA